jgi:hypothetical protein
VGIVAKMRPYEEKERPKKVGYCLISIPRYPLKVVVFPFGLVQTTLCDRPMPKCSKISGRANSLNFRSG